jgi:dipeptidase E
MTNKTSRTRPQRHIVAIGGALLTATPAVVESIYKYVLKLTGKTNPKVLIINTATGDDPLTLLRQYQAFADLPCHTSHLRFFDRTQRDLRSLVFSQDVIMVGGGNTKSMIAVWREYGLDKILSEAWEKGIVLAGSSAGAICWFEECSTDSYAEVYESLKCLGFLPGSCCPHYNADNGKRRKSYHRLLTAGEMSEGIAIDEHVAVHFKGAKVHKVLNQGNATAYRVSLKGKKIVEERLS